MVQRCFIIDADLCDLSLFGIVVVQRWDSIRSGASQISHGLALVHSGVVCVGSAKVQWWFSCWFSLL